MDDGFDALEEEWEAWAVYINPPFNDLKRWFAHAASQPGERLWLVPVRTHRKWWRKWRDKQLDAYVECDPLAFHGFKQKFPAPLLLGYAGERVELFEEHAARFGGFYAKR
jgi:hypothetical protein